MHIISYKKIKEFCRKYEDASTGLDRWYRIVKHEHFYSFSDVKKLFPQADQVGRFVVFDIGGNKYRLIAFLRYPHQRLFIRNILTHKEYDKDKWKKDKWFQNTQI